MVLKGNLGRWIFALQARRHPVKLGNDTTMRAVAVTTLANSKDGHLEKFRFLLDSYALRFVIISARQPCAANSLIR